MNVLEACMMGERLSYKSMDYKCSSLDSLLQSRASPFIERGSVQTSACFGT